MIDRSILLMKFHSIRSLRLSFVPFLRFFAHKPKYFLGTPNILSLARK